MDAALGDAMTNAALQLGATIFDAAFGAKVSWEEAIKSILRGIGQAIVQALILKAVQTYFGVGPAQRRSPGGIGAMAGRSSGGGIAAWSTPRRLDAGRAAPTPSRRCTPANWLERAVRGRFGGAVECPPAQGAAGYRPSMPWTVRTWSVCLRATRGRSPTRSTTSKRAATADGDLDSRAKYGVAAVNRIRRCSCSRHAARGRERGRPPKAQQRSGDVGGDVPGNGHGVRRRPDDLSRTYGTDLKS